MVFAVARWLATNKQINACAALETIATISTTCIQLICGTPTTKAAYIRRGEFNLLNLSNLTNSRHSNRSSKSRKSKVGIKKNDINRSKEKLQR